MIVSIKMFRDLNFKMGSLNRNDHLSYQTEKKRNILKTSIKYIFLLLLAIKQACGIWY